VGCTLTAVICMFAPDVKPWCKTRWRWGELAKPLWKTREWSRSFMLTPPVERCRSSKALTYYHFRISKERAESSLENHENRRVIHTPPTRSRKEVGDKLAYLRSCPIAMSASQDTSRECFWRSATEKWK
jgi:hypothetical protein